MTSPTPVAGSVPDGRGETGTFVIEGDYTQLGSASLEIDMATTGDTPDHDEIIITGAAAVAGTLNATLPAGVTGNHGDRFPA